jgi:PadR family transcriptional regulator PadR
VAGEVIRGVVAGRAYPSANMCKADIWAIHLLTYCIPIEPVSPFIWVNKGKSMGEKADVWQGTLALMILKTIETMGPQHGYGIARRIEQTSGNLLALNYGTLYPALLKLEQEGSIASEWGLSENKRKAKFYKLTRTGRKQLEKEARDWEQTTAILARFLAPTGDTA